MYLIVRGRIIIGFTLALIVTVILILPSLNPELLAPLLPHALALLHLLWQLLHVLAHPVSEGVRELLESVEVPVQPLQEYLADALGLVDADLEPDGIWKGRQRRNRRLKEKGSLLTAVAMFWSISIIWKFVDRLTWAKCSKISLLVMVSGMLSFSIGC